MIASVGFLPHPYNVYYEWLRPTAPTRRPPVLLIHGGAQTGACFRTTPDGRQGWADRLVAAGFPVVVADWPGTGRSGHQPIERIEYGFLAEAYDALVRHLGGGLVVLAHSMGAPIGWKLLETAADAVELVIGIAPAPPGNVQPPLAAEGRELRLRTSGVELVIDPARPVTDVAEYMEAAVIGRSTRFPDADWRPFTTWFPPRMLLQRLNLHGSALSLAETVDLARARAMIVTGTDDASHSRDHDEGIAHFLRRRGASVEFVWLGDHGIDGNGHMLMWEDNSLEVADLICERILAMLDADAK